MSWLEKGPLRLWKAHVEALQEESAVALRAVVVYSEHLQTAYHHILPPDFDNLNGLHYLRDNLLADGELNTIPLYKLVWLNQPYNERRTELTLLAQQTLPPGITLDSPLFKIESQANGAEPYYFNIMLSAADAD